MSGEILRQILQQMGVSEEAAAILSSLREERKGRRKAIVYQDPRIKEQFAEERFIRDAVRRAKEPAALVTLRSASVSPSQSIVEVRSGDTITIWQIRQTTTKRTPRTKRILAQQVPAVRVRTVVVERIIVSSPSSLVSVPLRMPGRASRIPIPQSEMKEILNPPSEWFLRIEGTNAVVALQGDRTEVREKLKRIKTKYPLARRLLLSCDLQRWVRLDDVYLP